MKSIILSENLGPVLLFYKDNNSLEKLKDSIIRNYFNKQKNEFDNIKNKVNNDKDYENYIYFKNRFNNLNSIEFFDEYFSFINLEDELNSPDNITINTYYNINGLNIYNDLIERKNISDFKEFDLIFVRINDMRLSDILRDI